jgi:hypothetical protein
MHGFPVICGDCECAVPPAGSEKNRGPNSETSLELHPSKVTELGLHAVYIKSYKVASTTTATIFQRIAEEQGLKAASRYNAGMPTIERMRGTFQLVFGHNFYDMGSKGGFPCRVKLVEGEWTYCGGYQPWMDFYVENAHHLVMISSPLSRMSSMYYYESGYTKQRDRAPGDASYQRINNEARFEKPNSDDRPQIQKFLEVKEYLNKWERVQWWWIRDMTEDKTVEQAIELLNTTFTIGLSHRFDESLLLWKATMRLSTRDILYSRMKASLPHPKVHQWAPQEQATAEALIESTGDAAYYRAAEKQFEGQVDSYGRTKLQHDVKSFQGLQSKLLSLCAKHAILSEQLHVPDQVYCFLRHYDIGYEQAYPAGTSAGCFSSLTTPDGRLSQKAFASQMSITTCQRRCHKESTSVGSKTHYLYFGLGHGTHCFCGVEVPIASSKVDDSKCNVPCGGNVGTTCGGVETYEVYRATVKGSDWVDPILDASAIVG